MERQEKVELILEQMRLCLATKDYIRAQIISKKINIRFFEKSEHQALKLKFYEYMIEQDQHEGTYLSICKHFRAVFDTPCIQVRTEKRNVPLNEKIKLYFFCSFVRSSGGLGQEVDDDAQRRALHHPQSL